MRIRVLGGLELDDGTGALDLGKPKQKTVLALLLVRAGTVVPADDLIDELWPSHAPVSAAANLRTYANTLRRLLATRNAAMLARCGSGFSVTLNGAEFDMIQFRRSAAAGRAALESEDYAVAAAHLQEALAWWRGPALTDVPLGPALTAWKAAVHEQRLSVMEDHVRALLGLSEVDQAAAEARGLLGLAPLREPAHALLMQARYAAGDVAGSLAAYETARRALDDELGIQPGEELQALHRAILNHDPALTPRGGAVTVATRHVPAVPHRLDSVIPRQLPSDVAGFTGREWYLRKLDELLSSEDDDRPAAVVLTAIAGTAGVGKTALAVHWAHRAAASFPDGQVYINLRGFDPTGSALAPTDALRTVLESFDVPPQRIPTTLDSQVGLYRSVLADKRVLIVLDNARDAGQVRPLLPGTASCLVIVTSRTRLTGLIATEAAHPLTVNLLTAAEARDMLTRRLGHQRVAAEPQATEEIIALCAGLPMALAIVAAQAATQPDFTLASIAAQLRQARGGLDAFEEDDSTTDMRAVFSWSYRTLTPAAANLFRLLGLHPGLDITVAATASLTGTSIRRVRPAVAELARAHLLIERSPGRYTCHDLLRTYAAELADQSDPPAMRAAATRRVLDHYLHTAHAADRLLRPDREPISLDPPAAGVAPEPLNTPEQALGWFTTEHPVLLATVRHAVHTGHDAHAWRLAWTLENCFDWGGHWHELAAAQQIALDAARRLSDAAGQAHAHRGLARAYARLRRLDDAHAHLQDALTLFGDLGDQAGLAATHRNLGLVLMRQGLHKEAFSHGQQALELHRAAGDVAGQALTLNNFGFHHALIGDHEQALAYCMEALVLYGGIDDRQGEAQTWDSLGYAHSHLGHHAEAVACYERAIDLFRNLGDRATEAETITGLGDAHRAAGNPTSARIAWQQALDILEELDHPDAAEIRARLDDDR